MTVNQVPAARSNDPLPVGRLHLCGSGNHRQQSDQKCSDQFQASVGASSPVERLAQQRYVKPPCGFALWGETLPPVRPRQTTLAQPEKSMSTVPNGIGLATRPFDPLAGDLERTRNAGADGRFRRTPEQVDPGDVETSAGKLPFKAIIRVWCRPRNAVSNKAHPAPWPEAGTSVLQVECLSADRGGNGRIPT
jgi:hypothetical protein